MAVSPSFPPQPGGLRLLDPPGDRAKRPHWWLEALVVLWLCWVYDDLTNLAPLRRAEAIRNAGHILHLERVLHIDPELALNHWMAAHHTLALWSSDYYDNAHFIVTLGVIGWLWWRHPSYYRPLRTTLALTNVVAFAVFWVFPMAPPRLLPSPHYIDVVDLSGAFGSSHSGALSKAADQFVAMPSLHMAWAAWSALAVWRVFRSSRWSWAAWAYPALTAIVVLTTGNHFVLDVVAGLVTLALCNWFSDAVHRRWDRARGLRASASQRSASPIRYS